jgi:hypothetical protein
MGGMFSVLKVRADQKPGDYKDPGWFKHPAGTVAYEWTSALKEPAHSQSGGGHMMDSHNMPAKDIEVKVRKPQAKNSHAGH